MTRKHFVLVCLCFVVTAAVVAAPPRVTVQMPPRIEDGASLVATVTLINTSSESISIYAPDSTSVRFRVTQRLDFGTGKWVQYANGGHSLLPRHAVVTLAPNRTVAARVPVLAEFPLGVAPGEYEIRAVYQVFPDVKGLSWYGAIESAPVPVTVAAPQTPPYEAFLRASKAAAMHDSEAPLRALEFAQQFPAHPYAAPLLVALIDAADPATVERTMAFITATYPGTEYAAEATNIGRAALERQRDGAVYKAYAQSLKEYARTHPDVAAAAQRSLGTILSASGFERAEAFVRRYPDSPFAAEGLWLMIDAVQHGVLPPGTASDDRDRVLAGFYSRLLKHSENYWAQRAAKDPVVAALLRKAQM